MTNGLTSADSWKFILYHDLQREGTKPSWSGTLPKEEQIAGMSLVVNTHYRAITKLRVLLDNDRANPIILTVQPVAERKQEFTWPVRKCRTITLEPVEWTEAEKPVIGIDNITLTAQRPNDFNQRVVPLVNNGGLVKYPNGKGGILLNQLQWPEIEANPENATHKRAVVATLLHNLGASFDAGPVVAPGQHLTYAPVPLGDKCNAFLKPENGPLDLSTVPVGERDFAGVRYDIRDFKTSPLPSAIAVGGKYPVRVSDIPVGRTADAIFFLHTAAGWATKPNEIKEIAQYTIQYKDGSTADVPIRLGREIALSTSESRPLPDASVAWKGNGQTVYQFQWTNPKPTVPLTAISISVSDARGTLVVLGLTPASEKK
jgi:beta-galactosidase